MKDTLAAEQQNGVERLDLERSLGVEEGTRRTDRTQEILTLFWQQRRFLLRVTGLGLVIAGIIVALLPNRYQSTTRLMPSESQNHSAAGMSMLAALTGGKAETLLADLTGMKGSGPLFVGILRSRTVEDRIVQQFDLKKIYRTRLTVDACKELEDNTQVQEDRKSGIISIAVTDKNPQRAAAMAKAYVEQLNRLSAELTTSAAHRERVFLEERLKGVKSDLDTAAKNFSQFSSQNTAIDMKEQGRAMVEAAANLQGQLIAVETELQGLRQIYSENNVRVRTARARIAELQRQLVKLGGDAGAPPDGAEGQVYPSIRRLPILGATYGDLLRQLKIQEAIYETLTKQYELARVEEAKEIPTVQVLDVANVPERKSSPHRLQILLFASVLSLALGMLGLMVEVRWAELAGDDYRKLFVRAAVARVPAPLRAFAHQFRNGASPAEMPQTTMLD